MNVSPSTDWEQATINKEIKSVKRAHSVAGITYCDDYKN